MINFFRKIRRKLADENSFWKYAKYAVGEIALIVVGVLVALFLNNLNTERSYKVSEIEILNEIKSNLNSSLAVFQRGVQTEMEYLKYNLLIMDYMDQKKPYSKELEPAFGVYFWTISSNPISGGYEFLKSKGIDLVTNDSLRKNISEMFENEFSILKQENEVWANNLQQNISYPYHVELFRRDFIKNENNEEIEIAKPFNYEKLLYDEKFNSINSEIISNRKWNIKSLQILIKKIQRLKEQIDNELTSNK